MLSTTEGEFVVGHTTTVCNNYLQVFRREQKNKLYVVLEFCMGSVQQLLDVAHENRLSDAETHRYFVDLIKG